MPSDRAPDRPPTPGETLESVPWSTLDIRSDPDRRWIVAAGAVVAAAVAVSAVRTLVTPDPVPPVPLTTSSVAPSPPTTIIVPVASTIPTVEGPADLLALGADARERLAVVVAEWSVAEFFSADASGTWSGVDIRAGAPVFVERVAGMAVSPLAPGRWEVLVAVSVWDGAGDGTFERRPVFGVSLEVVEDASGAMGPVGRPAPADVSLRRAVVDGVPVDEPDPETIGVATDTLRSHGWEVTDTPAEVTQRPDGTIRVVLVATDGSGATWPLEVVMGPDGSVVRPAGLSRTAP